VLHEFPSVLVHVQLVWFPSGEQFFELRVSTNNTSVWSGFSRLSDKFWASTVRMSSLATVLIDWLIDWLVGYDVMRLTSQNRGHHWPIVHHPGECEWRAVVMMMPTGDNSWLVYQISLAVLPPDTSGVSRRNGRKHENFAYLVSLIRQRIFCVL
jgi:hypothetical protein